MKKVILPILIVLAGLGAAFVTVGSKESPQAQPAEVLPPLVQVITVVSTPHQFVVRSQGSVQPRRDIQLVSEVAGRVVGTSTALAAGGFFERGETLITIDRRDYELAQVQAMARVRQAELRLTREKEEARVAMKEWEELGRSREEASPLLLREPQMAEAQAALAAAQANLDQAELNLARTEIKAPFPGRVWEKKVDIGQYVSPGETLGRLYCVELAEVRLPMALPDLAYLDLPADYRIEEDQSLAEVRLQTAIAGRIQEWTGNIVRIEGEIDVHSRMATLVAQVADPYDRARRRVGTAPLAVGLFVEAEIVGRKAEKTFTLPRIALRGQDRVLVVDDYHQLQSRRVNILRSERNEVIVGGGLEDGDKVCVSLLETLGDGTRVRVETLSLEAF